MPHRAAPAGNGAWPRRCPCAPGPTAPPAPRRVEADGARADQGMRAWADQVAEADQQMGKDGHRVCLGVGSDRLHDAARKAVQGVRGKRRPLLDAGQSRESADRPAGDEDVIEADFRHAATPNGNTTRRTRAPRRSSASASGRTPRSTPGLTRQSPSGASSMMRPASRIARSQRAARRSAPRAIPRCRRSRPRAARAEKRRRGVSRNPAPEMVDDTGLEPVTPGM
jgi:hypothetical protein